MSDPLMTFKSHVAGKNADVAIYVDRVEWRRESWMSTGAKLAAGAVTAGISLLATGVAGGQRGSEVIPMKSISSVTTKRDGLINTKVVIITTGNTIEFRVSHDLAQQVQSTLTSLLLGNHPAQQHHAPAVAPVAGAMPAGQPESPDIIGQIAKLGDLHKAGILTDEEFQTKKAELLGRL